MSKSLNKKYEWVSKNRYDSLPDNVIYAGHTSTDNNVYVGRVKNTPGKVNLENGTIYNFWVHGLGSYQSGEVLVSDNNYKWIDIKRDDMIPKNAVYSGIDSSCDKVWVGKSSSGEPGKINCHDNHSENPSMCNLWCHSRISSLLTGYILVIDEDVNKLVDEDETEEEKIETTKLKTEKLEYLHGNEDPEVFPLWKHCLVNTLSQTVKSSELEICAGNLAKSLYDVITASNLSFITLAELIQKFKINLSSNQSEERVSSKELIVSKPDVDGNSKYMIIIFSKLKTTKASRLARIFNASSTYLDIKVDYTILEPNNEPANRKCQQLIDEKMNSMINSFRPRELR